ncbi:unnamed protein product [Didymodactylos carnosus]|uniref:Uncharacterized protein n=1 Tax=Didymodactylos carnosus TaxID=1234261 RepID=A0A814ILS3_9BILA|nr:unnamed protein product [Didymodactylos carnosus]CAF1025247.1 unnamed protein product [Didymodactylos carnosus]CAF3735737.1 unnamed protein product [Didymodactylos carnosus]CAF3796466.1 unnamed protein product [Didymodactylos carnosus]
MKNANDGEIHVYKNLSAEELRQLENQIKIQDVEEERRRNEALKSLNIDDLQEKSVTSRKKKKKKTGKQSQPKSNNAEAKQTEEKTQNSIHPHRLPQHFS